MSNIVIVEHPRPCMPGPDSTAITVDLSDFGKPGYVERLLVHPSPEGGFVIGCLPFFTYGIQFGDLVAVRKRDMTFKHVVNQCGLRAFRMAFRDKAVGNQRHEEIHGRVIKTGFLHEWLAPGYCSILVRNAGDQAAILATLDDIIRDDTVCWEVDPEPFSLEVHPAKKTQRKRR